MIGSTGLLSRRPWLVWILFLMVYSPSVLTNIQGLTRPAGSAYALPVGASVQAQFGAAATFTLLQIAAAAGALTLLLLGTFRALDPPEARARLGLRWNDGRRLVLAGPGGAAVGYLAIVAGAGFAAAVLLDTIGVSGRPTAGGSIPNPVLLAGDYLMSIGAGIGEEVLLLAIPFALATRAGWKPLAILALLVGLRLSIHLYYGAGALFVLLWIRAAYLLYRATRSIFPLILGHIGYDLLAVTVQRSPTLHMAALALLIALAVAGAALLACSATRISPPVDPSLRHR